MVLSICYTLLHFDTPFKHAKHYLGFTEKEDIDERLHDHINGNGSKLMKAVTNAGITFKIARLWYNVTRKDERRMKNNRGAKYCPICKEEIKQKKSNETN